MSFGISVLIYFNHFKSCFLLNGLEQQIAHAEEAPVIEEPDNLQLGPPDASEEQGLATIEENEVSEEDKENNSLAIAQLDDLAEQDGSIDAKLMGVLEVVGNEEDWANKLEINRRSALLERTIRELAQDHPDSLAEALTNWMNDRHV